MNVMIIPEDFRKDQFILQPVIAAMLTALGKPRAKVDVCRDPLLGGISRALDVEELAKIIQDRPTVDLFLLCVDRDDEPHRRGVLDRLESELQKQVRKAGGAFFAENAWQEIEVWALAGHPLLDGWRWNDVRGHRDPKEEYFEPLAKSLGVDADDDGGRRKLGIQAARRYRRIYRLCKEDIQVLHVRLQGWLSDGAMLDWDSGFGSLG